MTRTASILVACALALGGGAAMAQDAHGEGGPHAGMERPDPHFVQPPRLGFDPMKLEISDEEMLSFPRGYEEKPCADEVLHRIFVGDVSDEFLASLRCWVIPYALSGEFVQALDEAIEAANWDYVDAAGMGAHYRKEGKELDVLVFGMDRFSDPDDTDVGYLFGVVNVED